MLVGLGSAAVAGLAMPNLLIGGAKAQGKYKLDLGGYTGPEPTSQPITLRMAKIDPKGDFSSDYEDLDFQRIGGCR